jgi:hypothetical protein
MVIAPLRTVYRDTASVEGYGESERLIAGERETVTLCLYSFVLQRRTPVQSLCQKGLA